MWKLKLILYDQILKTNNRDFTTVSAEDLAKTTPKLDVETEIGNSELNITKNRNSKKYCKTKIELEKTFPQLNVFRTKMRKIYKVFLQFKKCCEC